MPHFTKITDECKSIFIDTLRESGSVAHAMRRTGVKASRAAWYERRKKNPEFAQQWADAVEDSVDVLEEEARRRAVEGVLDPVWWQGEQVGTVRKYSDGLLQFLLKGNRNKYRDKVDHAHEVGGAVRLIIQTVQEGQRGITIEGTAEEAEGLLEDAHATAVAALLA